MNLWEKIGVAIAGIAVVAGIAYHAVADIPGSSAFTLSTLPKLQSIAIVVDYEVYASDILRAKIDRFRTDIILGTGMAVKIIPAPSPRGWDSDLMVKSVLAKEYANSNLTGAILMGDIPVPYFEYQDSNFTPSDWYYQDLSDKFIDIDGDGRFERESYMKETDITRREIWTSRLKPPIEGPDGLAMLSDYLDRNHAYRTGQIAYDKKMLFFNSLLINHKEDDLPDVTEDQYIALVNQIHKYTGLYNSEEDVDYVYSQDLRGQKDQYLKKLSDMAYDFVFVNIHGTWGSQWLGDNVYVSRQEIRDAASKAFFVQLASCSNGNFTVEDYFAGNLLFGGNTLAVAANTVDTMYFGDGGVGVFQRFKPLRLGVSFGAMLLNDGSFLPRHILGDPTLQLRPKPTGKLPIVGVNQKIIDFGLVKKGELISRPVGFSNSGQSQLTIEYDRLLESVDTEPILGDWGFVTYKSNGRDWAPINIPPHASTKVIFTLNFPKNIPGQQYSATQMLFTNDPNRPYLELKFKATVVN